MGTVIAYPSQPSERTLPDDSLCTVTLPVAESSLSDPHSPELDAYFHPSAARSSLTAKSSPLSATATVARASAPRPPSVSRRTGGPRYLYGGLTPGRHHGELTIHVAGATVDPPPVSFDFELTCDDSRWHEAGGCSLGGGHGDRAAGGLLVGLAMLVRRRRWRASRS